MDEWFRKITVKEYDDLIKNKNKMYNISKNFTSPELMNKYRDEDQIINEKLKLMNNNYYKMKICLKFLINILMKKKMSR